MIYNDKRIRRLIDDKVIIGAEAKQVNPASLNIRLGHTFLSIIEPQFRRLGRETAYEEITKLDGRETVTIMPGAFVLATTLEQFDIPDHIAAFVQGRSSIGRVGLMVQNAGFVDPGFRGHITLELKNDTKNPIMLVPGYPVAQMIFFETEQVEEPYHGKYNGQVEATGSRMEQDWFWESEGK